ncbi:hypothetical protein [Flavobacterium sp. FlaQc-28]|uniref:hypothetical protein n=1 Tax=Flavobacterium sp. FlaQc-28 TaxID=3374178 RepID=UPI003757DB45
MTIADLIKDFIDTSRERLKTPISGAFLWSFLIFNWRPVVLLFFSKASIEDKIIIINHEYCNFWAIFWPVVIATFYTLLIPKIMLQIDNDLVETKKNRMDNNYIQKGHEVTKKQLLAEQEVVLNDIMSGNKSKQELIEKISSLEEANSQRAIADKLTIDSLNLKLAQANNTIINIQTRHPQRKGIGQSIEDKNLFVDHIYSSLSPKTRKTFYDIINSDGKITLEHLSSSTLNTILDYDLFIKDSEDYSKWLITDIGLRLFNRISRSIQKNNYPT